MFGFNEFINQILGLFQWWVVVAPWEGVIRVRRGNKITVLKPGIHFRIPGLDRFFSQGIKKRYMNVPTQTVTTRDRQALTISGGTAYNISDIRKLYDTLNSPSDVIQLEAMSLVAKYVNERDLKDITLKNIEEYVTGNLNLEKYGLQDISFLISDYVCVKTYRLIQSSPKDFEYGSALNTNAEKQIGLPR